MKEKIEVCIKFNADGKRYCYVNQLDASSYENFDDEDIAEIALNDFTHFVVKKEGLVYLHCHGQYLNFSRVYELRLEDVEIVRLQGAYDDGKEA